MNRPLHQLHHHKPFFAKFGLNALRHKTIICTLLFFLFVLCSKDILFRTSTRLEISVSSSRLIFKASRSNEKTGIECYQLQHKDEDILEISDYNVLPNSIFFLETSCRHGSRIDITKRQACAYESAAKVHPTSEVLVLFPSPITLRNQSRLVSELLKYPNIKLLHVDMGRYFLGTPLERFYAENWIEESFWPKVHTSDVLRLLTLWKYGGTYLDSDFIMMRPINTMDNFAGAESDTDVATGILNFNISNSGWRIIFGMVAEIRDRFRGWDWGSNGPNVISRVLRRICHEHDVREMTPEKCGNFTVFPPSAFYPVPYQKWQTYFRENVSQDLLDQLGQSYGIHVWNQLSSNTPVKIGSRMPYSVFASKFCPRIYSVAGSYF